MALMKEQLKQAKKPMEMPDLPPPPEALPPPPPPVGESSADAADAAEEARRRALRRTNSARGTLFAGENSPTKQPLGGQKTLLG